MPFPSGYAGYDSVTPANPAGTLTDFFYVLNANLLSSTWWANVKSDGGDVQAYNPSGDRLPVYLHNWNYGANTGLIFIGYTGTKLTTSETIRIYAGKPSESQPAAGDAYGQYAVFPSTLRGIWPDGLGNDLTSYANHATSFGSPTVGGVAGPISGSLATDFNGTSQYGTATASVPTATPIVMLAVANSDNNTSAKAIVSVADTAVNNHYFVLQDRGADSGDPVYATTAAGGFAFAQSASGFTTATWQSRVAAFNSTTSRYAGINGVLGAQSTTSISPTSIDKIAVGAWVTNSASQHYDGKLSFVRLHTGALSADWIAYDSAMMAPGTQSGFYTTGGWTADSASSARLLLTNAAYFGGKL